MINIYDYLTRALYKIKEVVTNSDISPDQITSGALIGDVYVEGKQLTAITDAFGTNEDGTQSMVITDVINARFDTQSKTILASFTFGTSGALQVGTYSAGVSGDIKISPNGILARNSSNATTFALDATTGDATFAGTLVAAAGTLGSITAGTFTGCLFRTGASGARVRITSASASTPTQSANSIAFIDSNDLVNAFIGTGYELGSILTISPKSDVTGAYFYDASTVDLTSNLVNINMNSTSSTGKALAISNEGTGITVDIAPSNATIGLNVGDIGATASTVDLVRVTSNKACTAVKVIKTNDTGYPFYIDSQNASSIYQAAYITNAGASAGLVITQSNSSGAGIGLSITQARANKEVASFQGTVTSTHFYKLISLQTVTLYTSDGTTPSGNLGANVGDICYNGDSGKPYWNNNGSTGWTAF
jgi:hypothetical protein